MKHTRTVPLLIASALAAVPGCGADTTGLPEPEAVEGAASALTLDPTTTQVVSLQSYNYPGYYVRHQSFYGELSPIDAGSSSGAKSDGTFRAVPGLAGGGTISFESANFPGYYLRQVSFRMQLQSYDGTAQFKNDASFRPRAGLSDAASMSFESPTYPGRYLRHRDFHMYLEASNGSSVFAQDATFRVMSPLMKPFDASLIGQCRTISATDVGTIACNANEVMVDGGGTCHAEWDDHLVESRPTSTRSLKVTCVNHDNSSMVHAPATISATCCPGAFLAGAHYIENTDASASISCGGEVMAFGGGYCRYWDWDQRLLKSLPPASAADRQVDLMCMNHDDSGSKTVPAGKSAVCIPRADGIVSQGAANPHLPQWCAPRCTSSQVLMNAGAECVDIWDDLLLSNRPTSPQSWDVRCMNHQNSGMVHAPKSANGMCYGPPTTPTPPPAQRPPSAPAWAEQQARAYAPVFVLHPSEAYWPVDPRDYITQSSVSFAPSAGFTECDEKLDSIGTISTPAQKLNTYLTLSVNGNPVFDVMGGSAGWSDCGVAPILCGRRPNNVGELNAVPVFAILSDKPSINAVDVYYWAFFGYNQGKDINMVFGTTSMGNHFGDWVHASIRFNRTTGAPTQLFMDHHGELDDYSLRQWGTGFQTTNGRPVVYLAQGSHEAYPSAGMWDRAKGYPINIHDYTAEGMRWDTSVSLKTEWIYTDGKIYSGQGNNWLNYNGRYGIPGAGNCAFGGCQREDGAPSPSPSERAFMARANTQPDG